MPPKPTDRAWWLKCGGLVSYCIGMLLEAVEPELAGIALILAGVLLQWRQR